MSPQRPKTVRVYYDGENVAYAEYAQKTKSLKAVLDAVQWAVRTKIAPAHAPAPSVLQYWYGDATSGEMQRHKDAVLERGLATRLVYTVRSKNSCDLAMTVDMMRDAYENTGLGGGERTDVYVVVTSDSDFRHVVQAMREKGRRVVGVGYRSCSSANVAAAYDAGDFLYIEDLVAEHEATPEEQAKRANEALKKEGEALKREGEALRRNAEALKKEGEAQKRNAEALKKESEAQKRICETLKKERDEALALATKKKPAASAK